MGIKKTLTFHISRHSVAYHLMSGSSIHTIKEVLGHSDTRTTEIYLKELGDELIDVEMVKLYGN
ncbi:tyrosine-type recombinase/integrase [Flavitalea sp.]